MKYIKASFCDFLADQVASKVFEEYGLTLDESDQALISHEIYRTVISVKVIAAANKARTDAAHSPSKEK